ncbi:SDR family NAD(P)-dependent oxidoreductase [Notoacmeibacter marinus]|uniref:SDR family NAD(P)-dependent oxidoreductase n=1 Tax=Notoacmeibacter marinus TaxID=1876515 RepID=UPI000DF234E8|nr:SDR family NAD(P)-dependent oxidoreductase [Notoacmeibacter marinus]
MPSLALVVGTGPGLSASIARAFAARSYRPVLAARDTSDLADLRDETNGVLVDCDASDPDDVARLFATVDDLDGALEVAVYNPSARSRGPIAELNPQDVRNALDVTAFGAFLMAHHAARRMQVNGRGTMLFTGASAGVKGFAESAPFAMGKFALRGLCQSLARELHPKNIHIGHVVIDGGIAGTPQHGRSNEVNGDDYMLDPDQVAKAYMNLIDQHRSTWAWEIELRPWIETF